MKTKQIAWMYVPGDGSFTAGIETLKKSCESAHLAITAAINDWSFRLQSVCRDDAGRVMKDWGEELSLGLALHCQVACGRVVGPKQQCKIEERGVRCTTASGLVFGWSRWKGHPGYSFFVIHPSGQFPEESTLRASLDANGWRIETYKN